MTENKTRLCWSVGAVLLGGLTMLAGCAPAPVTRTVTTQTTTAVPPPPPVVTTTTVEEVNTPDRPYVRPRVARVRRAPVRTDEVIEETTETVAPPPVAHTTTRSTTQTINPR